MTKEEAINTDRKTIVELRNSDINLISAGENEEGTGLGSVICYSDEREKI